jgi:hypothetical protein
MRWQVDEALLGAMVGRATATAEKFRPQQVLNFSRNPEPQTLSPKSSVLNRF